MWPLTVRQSTGSQGHAPSNGGLACGSISVDQAAQLGVVPAEDAGRGIEFHGGLRDSLVDELTLEAPKTKLQAEKFKAMGLESVLVITDTVDENLYLASRNLAHVAVVEPRYADPLSLIYFKKILITKAAVAQIEELLS